MIKLSGAAALDVLCQIRGREPLVLAFGFSVIPHSDPVLRFTTVWGQVAADVDGVEMIGPGATRVGLPLSADRMFLVAFSPSARGAVALVTRRADGSSFTHVLTLPLTRREAGAWRRLRRRGAVSDTGIGENIMSKSYRQIIEEFGPPLSAMTRPHGVHCIFYDIVGYAHGWTFCFRGRAMVGAAGNQARDAQPARAPARRHLARIPAERTDPARRPRPSDGHRVLLRSVCRSDDRRYPASRRVWMILRNDERALGAACVAAVSAVAALCGCAATNRQPVRTFVRNCRDGVGHGGVSSYSQSQALHVGPLSLGELGALTLASLDPARPGQTRFGALEDIAVIKAGAVVTVAVPPFERAYVGLIYDASKFRDDGAYRIRDLDPVVRFEACKNLRFNHGLSQFDGGVVVAGRRCFALDFYIRGRRSKIERRLPPRGCGPAPSSPLG